jgi:hypothetical protein
VSRSQYPFRISDQFEEIPPSVDRKSPENLRRLLYDTIDQEFDRYLEAASNAFREALNKVKVEDRRGYDVASVSPDTLYKAVRGKTGIGYGIINALAKYYKVPISVLLLYTRIRDEMETIEKRNSREAWRVLSSFRAAFDHIERQVAAYNGSEKDILELFGHNQFLSYVAVYTARLNAQIEQPELDLFSGVERRQTD